MKNFVKNLKAKVAEKKGSLSVEMVLLIVVFTFVVVLALSGLGNRMKTTIEDAGNNIDVQTRCVAAGGEWFPNGINTSTHDALAITGDTSNRCGLPK